MDIWSKEKRSLVMSKIRSRDTKPEMILRSALFKLGYRFRIHKKNLPGKPDIVLPKYRTVIFVHGCFWHYHIGCGEGKIPKSNSAFWKEKLEKNVVKDNKYISELRALRWRVLVIWECEIENNLDKKIIEIVKLLRP